MTDRDLMTEGAARPGWAGRLSSSGRLIATMLLGLLVIFLGGAIIGFSVAMLEDGGPHAPLAWAALAAFVATFSVVAVLLWQLLKSWRSPELSAFDRRYYRMWGIVMATGIPIGIGLAFLGEDARPGEGAFLGNGPIDPALSLGFCAAAVLLLAIAAVVYHRSIDDHEERAYLWGSTAAFYFIAAAIPVAWLLARGGWIDPVGIGAAAVILLLSFVIQTAVWLWIKFR